MRGGSAHPAALKRKLTLLALIDELSALKDEDANMNGMISTTWEDSDIADIIQPAMKRDERKVRMILYESVWALIRLYRRLCTGGSI